MTFREFTGKNVEEAIRSAMKEFESDLSELDIEILSQGSRGILGVGGEEARILAAPRSAVAAAPSVREAPPPEDAAVTPSDPSPEAPDAIADLSEAKVVLEEFLRLMDLSGTVEIAMGTETAKLNVKGDDLGVLIGRRGEKLASLQHLVNLIIARREGQTLRIAIDVENYRGRREDQLRDVARRAAERVLQPCQTSPRA